MSWVNVCGIAKCTKRISNSRNVVDIILTPYKFDAYLYVKPREEIMDVIREMVINERPESNQQDIYITSFKIVTCLGCVYGELGQKPHMDPGGCLYEDSDEELENEEVESEYKKMKTMDE